VESCVAVKLVEVRDESIRQQLDLSGIFWWHMSRPPRKSSIWKHFLRLRSRTWMSRTKGCRQTGKSKGHSIVQLSEIGHSNTYFQLKLNLIRHQIIAITVSLSSWSKLFFPESLNALKLS
jgi:hypothetical protein